MKKIFIILVLVVLASCMPKYLTSTLLHTEQYEYKISYPQQWSIFYGSTDASRYQLDKGFLDTIAIINKYEYAEKTIFNVNKKKDKFIIQDIIGKIEVFLLNKDSKLYKNWTKNLISGKLDFVFMIEDFSDQNDKKLNISYSVF
ncbi:MAG: hypothetical protein Ta2D_10670 [Rickettsiales bacterium]|nr:MAG: hypothetical protein Ta2D_10670 [Rickettsiales bacterium]